jgi:hypothetical protein
MILCTNYDYSHVLDDAREWAKETYPVYSDDDVYEYAQRIVNDDVSFHLECIEKYLKNHKLIAVGDVERWDGTFSGGKVIENYRDFSSLFDDCYYIEISDVNNYGRCIKLRCSHHDGTDVFYIKELTDKGYEYYLENCFDVPRSEYCTYLFRTESNSCFPQIEWSL